MTVKLFEKITKDINDLLFKGRNGQDLAKIEQALELCNKTIEELNEFNDKNKTFTDKMDDYNIEKSICLNCKQKLEKCLTTLNTSEVKDLYNLWTYTGNRVIELENLVSRAIGQLQQLQLNILRTIDMIKNPPTPKKS